MDVREAMREAMRETRADVVEQAQGVSEGCWGSLMVLGCGGVCLGGARELAEGMSLEPEPELEWEPRAKLQPASELKPQMRDRVKRYTLCV